MKSLKEELIEQYGRVMKPDCVANELHCHPAHVRALCATGEIPAKKIGDRWIIPTAKFADLLERGFNE